jgi:hypothetical protein
LLRRVIVESAVHDIRVDVAFIGVSEGGGERADDLESEGLPKPHCVVFRADDDVLLHGPVALGLGQLE